MVWPTRANILNAFKNEVNAPARYEIAVACLHRSGVKPSAI